MTDRNLDGLHGDDLTWALHRENRSNWKAVRQTQRILLVLFSIMLASQLGNVHVGVDPTFTLHFPW